MWDNEERDDVLGLDLTDWGMATNPSKVLAPLPMRE